MSSSLAPISQSASDSLVLLCSRCWVRCRHGRLGQMVKPDVQARAFSRICPSPHLFTCLLCLLVPVCRSLPVSQSCYRSSDYLHAKSLQLCLTLCNPVDRSPPGSSVHGILQARILEWVAISYSRGSSQPRSLMSSALADRFFTTRTTWEALH